MSRFTLLNLLALLALASPALAAPELKLAGDWKVQVTLPGTPPLTAGLAVSPPSPVEVTGEKIDSLPLFNPAAGGWVRGAKLARLRTQETTAPGLLDPASLVLRLSPDPASPALERGRDYEADLTWGTVGRLPASPFPAQQAVYASYRFVPLRLDAVVLTQEGRLEIRQGEPHPAVPRAPAVAEGERHLANIWLPGALPQLREDCLFPVLETAYPEPAPAKPSPAEKLLPNTLRKLQNGEPLRLLAWGDSVTVGTFVPDPDRNRWQAQFVARLQQRFPRAKIELITEAWGGRNTGTYLAEPPGSLHNYREKVLDAKPGLIVSEFVNDSGLSPAQVEERYGKLLADFQGIGAEWIILTPHYVHPDWMKLPRERDVDQDPRPYVAGLRTFAAAHPVALADASLRYGRLWRQGIPYRTVLLNSVNHPDERGMKLFADALMALFP